MTVSSEINDRIDKCQKIMELDPNSQIFAALADAHRKKGELDKAFRVCQNGLKIHPSYGAAHVVMAKINMDRGLYDWAEAEIKKAVELDGTSRSIDLLLAEILIYKGEFVEAVKLLKKLHQSDPDNKQIKKLLDIAQRIPEEQKVLMSSSTKVAQGTASATAEEVPPFGARKPVSMNIGEIVRQALTLPDMQGALFVNNEGLVTESEWTLEMDSQTCGATMYEIINFLTQEMINNSFGRVRKVLIENKQLVFYLHKVTDGLFLFIGDARISLGNMRMKLSGLVDNYQPS
ncbi:MAG: tetratricopeptide repeat protein [candidate division Zixibacteria bacterium]|nr:tetratricopeptide repeat protein [candidate division Zixibacteria bacterium]MDD5426915.1 tetratricopeptide repeat protein [candidate division Zixibacteria bacterium]